MTAGPRTAVRSRFNALLVAVTLVVALPLVAAAERVRAGAGRRLAVCTARLLARACGVTVDIDRALGAEPRNVVFTPNHSSPVDIVAVLLAEPEARFVAAAELFRIPFLGAAMRALGTLPIDRQQPTAARDRMIAAFSDAEAPSRWVVFAQGGIAPTGAVLRFKTGAFSMAIAAGALVVPVSIEGAEDVLPPGHRIAVRPGRIVARFLDPIVTDGLGSKDRRWLRDHAQAAVVAARRQAA